MVHSTLSLLLLFTLTLIGCGKSEEEGTATALTAESGAAPGETKVESNDKETPQVNAEELKACLTTEFDKFAKEIEALQKKLRDLFGTIAPGNSVDSSNFHSIHEEIRKRQEALSSHLRQCVKQESGSSVPSDRFKDPFKDWSWERFRNS